MKGSTARVGPDEHEFDPRAPRRNPDLVGHRAAEAMLAGLAEAGRLPHAIILAGPMGVGKATLAYRFARWLLARPDPAEADGLFGAALPAAPSAALALDPDHPVARRVAAAGHADLMTVERGRDPKTKRLRGEIVVKDVQAIAQFLHLTPAEGGWRVVIVDSADEMNRNAANALLKILEEPPRRALLLLVCHAPGRLLPTIRSRCRRVDLATLPDEAVDGLLAAHRPDLEPAERQALARLAAGSIGRCLDLAEAGGLELYRRLIALLAPLPALDIPGVHQLAEDLARNDAGEAFRTMAALLPDWLERMVGAAASGRAPAETVPGEAALAARLAGSGRLDRWVDVWESLRALFQRAEAINLDKKQTILDSFLLLAATAK